MWNVIEQTCKKNNWYDDHDLNISYKYCLPLYTLVKLNT